MSLEGTAIGVLMLIGLVIIVMLAAVVLLGWKLWRKVAVIRHPDAPTSAKVAFWAGLGYAVFPIDLLPDPILIDDIAVLVAALHHLANVARQLGIEAPSVTRRSSLPGDTTGNELT